MTFSQDYPGAIGIDLGTTYSCVAAMIDGRVEVITNEQGSRTTPSYVAFTEEGEPLIGDSAKNQAASNALYTIFDAKRLIGRRFAEDSVKKDMKLWPFVVKDIDGSPHIEVCKKDGTALLKPQEISALVLKRMKEIAELKLGQNVKKAVITVPAYFNDAQRQATKDAGLIAGLDVLRIINEPTAAAIAYGLDQRNKDAASGIKKKERVVLIFDLGGGTFDVSLLTVADGVFTVKATSGNTHLGGEDFDNCLVNYFVEEFKTRHHPTGNIYDDARALRRLRTSCELAKRSLSSITRSTFEIDAFFESIDFSATLTRAKLEELNSKDFASTLEPVIKVLADAKIDKSAVEDIVLVGGSTRIPKIQSLLAKFFGIPKEQLNKSINPDEAVAYGAAVQGAVLTGTGNETTSDILLLDVVPLSLGVQLQDGTMGIVIPRNTSIPTILNRVFTTVHDNQSTVEFPIHEGERLNCCDNNLLGNFTLSGLPAVPRGVPEIETIFELDANGLLKVTAIERNFNKTATVTISNKAGRLTNDEISRIVSEAERHRDTDDALAKKLEAKHTLQEFIYQTESTLRDATLAARLKGVDSVVDELATALEWLEIDGKNASVNEIQSKHRKLETMVTKVFSAVYSQSGSEKRRGGRNRRN